MRDFNYDASEQRGLKKKMLCNKQLSLNEDLSEIKTAFFFIFDDLGAVLHLDYWFVLSYSLWGFERLNSKNNLSLIEQFMKTITLQLRTLSTFILKNIYLNMINIIVGGLRL